MTLDEAFSQLISRRAWYKNIKAVTSPQYAQEVKKRYKAGTLGDDVKRRLLIQSGYYTRREYWYEKGKEKAE